jgi:hypothetical protein
MAWFKVDDGFYTSLKFLSMPRKHQVEAAGIWLLTGTWSADKMTDGFVPYAVMDIWQFSEDVITSLLSVGLWDHDEERNGIQFHDWCDYQPTREALEAKAVARSEKARENVAKRWDKVKVDTTEIPTAYESDTNALPKDTPEPEPEPEPSITKVIDINHQGNFDEFWEFYPRKVGKGASQQALSKALKRSTWQEILAGVQRLAADPNLPEKQFIPHPATWLNEGRWADEPYSPRGKTNQREAQREQASAKFLASFSQQPELTANPDWA